MKKFINIRIIFKLFLFLFLPLYLNGYQKIKPVFPFEELLNRQIYLDELFKSRGKKQKIVESKFGYNDSEIFGLKIFNRKDFIGFDSRIKSHFSINKFRVKIDSLNFSLNNFNWENRKNLKILNPAISYSKKNILFNFNTKYQYFSNFDFHDFNLNINNDWFEIPIKFSATKKYFYNTGFRVVRKNATHIFAGGLNYSNIGKTIYPFALISLEKNSRFFVTSQLSLIQESYPISNYFSEKSLFWKSQKPKIFENALNKKELKLNIDWQNSQIEQKFCTKIYSSKKSWKYIWEKDTFYIGTENEEQYTLDLSYSLKRRSFMIFVKHHLGYLEDFRKESKISIQKKIFSHNIESDWELSWINNLKINLNKYSYPELKIKLFFEKINSYLEVKYSYIREKAYPNESNLYLSIGANLCKQK